eukprot:gene17603-biopygen11951
MNSGRLARQARGVCAAPPSAPLADAQTCWLKDNDAMGDENPARISGTTGPLPTPAPPMPDLPLRRQLIGFRRVHLSPGDAPFETCRVSNLCKTRNLGKNIRFQPRGVGNGVLHVAHPGRLRGRRLGIGGEGRAFESGVFIRGLPEFAASRASHLLGGAASSPESGSTGSQPHAGDRVLRGGEARLVVTNGAEQRVVTRVVFDGPERVTEPFPAR